ncbi:delta-lactam-biosynthetic de-N-acetylase [Desulforudis sp. 1088]|uniref:delta-lactam-biosynthetic de-N-acetylase n=1 Tax=unclassified Candidatus Desulforudis TaxID=2635950 RepID=UPI003CE56DB3
MAKKQKKVPVVLFLSLALNLALGAYVLFGSGAPAGDRPVSGGETRRLTDEIAALKQEITQLRAENEKLRKNAGQAPQTVTPDSQDQTVYSWYFRRNSEHKPPTTDAAFVRMFNNGKGLYLGDTASRKIYLTFDEGYENGYTSHILDVLRDNEVPAAFFVTGPYVRSQPELVKRMAVEGHVIGNHTQNHPSMPKVSNTVLRDEILSVHEQVRSLTGREMRFLRPPMGEFNQRTIDLTAQLGYKTVFWSMAYKDWDVQNQPGREAAVKHVLDNVHPGAVILLHAVSQSNAEALDTIIKQLKAQGYVFGSLEELR